MKWFRQPTYPAQIDKGNPLSNGLQILLLPVGGRLLDVLNPGVDWAPNGNAQLLPTPKGNAASFDGVSDYFSCTSQYSQLSGAVGTFFCFAARVGAGDTYGHVIFGSNTGASTYFQVAAGGAPVIFGATPTSGAVTWLNSTNTSLVLSSGGSSSTLKAFSNGVDSGAAWSASPTAWGSGAKSFNFGRWIGGIDWDTNADIVIAGFSSRAWTENDAKLFHANPWQIFQPLKSNIYGPAAGGSAALTGTVTTANASDTSAAAGTTSVIGTLAKSNINDTSSASGTTTVLGAVAYTNINDSVSASGYAAPVSGAVAYANSNDTVTADGITTIKAGGDDAFHHVGWNKKAWQKKQKRDELITETIAQTYRKLTGEEPEQEVIKTIKSEIPKSPIVENKKTLDYTQEAQFIDWLSQQVEAIKQQRYLAELDDEETLLLLL